MTTIPGFGLQWYLQRAAGRLTQPLRCELILCAKQLLMKMQNYNDLKVSINCSAAEHHRRKNSLLDLLLNAAARSDAVDGEDNMVLLPKAAGVARSKESFPIQGLQYYLSHSKRNMRGTDKFLELPAVAQWNQ